MKILHVVQGYYPAIGGTEWLIQRLSEELVRQFQDDVTVFTTDCLNGEGFFKPEAPRLKAGWEERRGVKIRRFPVQRRLAVSCAKSNSCRTTCPCPEINTCACSPAALGYPN